MADNKLVCESCRYHDSHYNECRRNPPHLIMVAQEVMPGLEIAGQQRGMAQTRVQYGFPKVIKAWWCGEYQPDQPAMFSGAKGDGE